MTQIFSAAVDWAVQRRPSSRSAKLTALALILGAGVLGVTTQVIQSSQAATRHQTGPFIAKWQRGYYVSNGWLCYGWSNGAYHCTAWWHQDASGHYISDNPSWVPNVGQVSGGATGGKSGASPLAYTVSGAPAAPSASGNHLNNPWCNSDVQFPTTITQWTVPVSCYSGIYTTPNEGYPSYGWCNYIPEMLHPWLGKTTAALYLPGHGGFAPKVGATVYFSGGEQGASPEGHYAEVVAVGPNGWNLVVEMNFYWRGGGFAKVDFRYIHNSAGITYRY